MQLSFLPLALLPVWAYAAAVLPRLDDTYSFTVFPTSDCTPNDHGNLTLQGTTANFPVCSAPLEITFGSVLVDADADSRCSITFFNQTINPDEQCRGPVASEPGSITKGECFVFDSSNRPITYGVVCG